MSDVHPLWAAVLHPGKSLGLPTGRSYCLQNASLTGGVASCDERTELVLSFSPAPEGQGTAVICVLTPFKTEQTVLSIALSASQSYRLTAHGPNSLSILGSCSEPLNPSTSGGIQTPFETSQRVYEEDAHITMPDPAPRLPSLSQIVVHGSRVAGLIAVRPSKTDMWFCKDEKVFVGVVVGSGYFPADMHILGMRCDMQRKFRFPTANVSSWLSSRGYRVPGENTVVFVIGITSIDNI